MNLVSVVVPVYNVAPFFDRCIRSILEQTYPYFELILVDDGSTDGSGKLCDEAALKDERIYVIHQKNKGLSAARNAGIDKAKGDYITFIDSDDFVSRYYLEHLVDAKEKTSSEVAICGHRAFKSERFTEVSVSLVAPVTLSKEEILNTALIGVPFFVSAWTKLYDRSLFKDLRYPEGELYEDLGIFYRLFSGITRGCYIDEPLYYYYLRSGSILRSEFNKRKLSYLKFAEEGLSFIKEYYPGCREAAELKVLAASIDTLLMIGLKKNDNIRPVKKKCCDNIVRYRDAWRSDSRLRKLYRIIIYLSYLAIDIPLVKKIWF